MAWAKAKNRHTSPQHFTHCDSSQIGGDWCFSLEYAKKNGVRHKARMANALVRAKPEQLCRHHAGIPVMACVISKKRNKRNNSSRVESFFAKSALFAYCAYSVFSQNKTEYSYLPKIMHRLTIQHGVGVYLPRLGGRPKKSLPKILAQKAPYCKLKSVVQKPKYQRMLLQRLNS